MAKTVPMAMAADCVNQAGEALMGDFIVRHVL
jgi:hypothetical protein